MNSAVAHTYCPTCGAMLMFVVGSSAMCGCMKCGTSITVKPGDGQPFLWVPDKVVLPKTLPFPAQPANG